MSPTAALAWAARGLHLCSPYREEVITAAARACPAAFAAALRALPADYPDDDGEPSVTQPDVIAALINSGAIPQFEVTT